MVDRETSGRPDHGVLSLDTSPAAERLQVELWRRMSPIDKARTVSALTRATQELSLAGIRQRYPHASEREWFVRLAVLTLGRRLTARVYPDAPALLHS